MINSNKFDDIFRQINHSIKNIDIQRSENL